VDAYRTDPAASQANLGGGAAPSSLGIPGANVGDRRRRLVLGRSLRLAGGLPAAAALMLAVVPFHFTLAAPRLAPIVPSVTLRQAVVGRRRNFLRRTGGSRRC